jgi:Tol biopolymer transport system component
MWLIKYVLVFAVLFFCTYSVTAQDKKTEDKIFKVLWEEGVENAYPRWSDDGAKILYQSNRTGKWQVYVMDKNGSNQQRITNDEYNNNFPDWSPDNKQIAFVSDREDNEDIYIMNMDGSGLKNLSSNPARDIHPYWSPNGEKILFNSSRDDEESFEVYQIIIDGTGLTRLTNSEDVETCARLSPDDTKIVCLRGTPGGNDEICVMNSDGKGKMDVTESDSNEGWPVWTPDGKQIIFSSTWYGQFSLFSMNADGSDMKRLTFPESPFYDARASVSPDGKEIVFNRQAKGTIGIYILELE